MECLDLQFGETEIIEAVRIDDQGTLEGLLKAGLSVDTTNEVRMHFGLPL